MWWTLNVFGGLGAGSTVEINANGISVQIWHLDIWPPPWEITDGTTTTQEIVSSRFGCSPVANCFVGGGRSNGFLHISISLSFQSQKVKAVVKGNLFCKAIQCNDCCICRSFGIAHRVFPQQRISKVWPTMNAGKHRESHISKGYIGSYKHVISAVPCSYFFLGNLVKPTVNQSSY